MTEQRVEFGIETAEREGDEWVVIGRCHHGPIGPGTRFDRLFRVRYEKEGLEVVSSTRIDERPVELLVKTSEYWGRFLPLDSGSTGRLRLIGAADGPPLGPDDVLAG